jgi:hypothetical protein
VRVQYGASTCYEYTYDRPSSTYKQCKLRVDRTGYCIDRQSASRRFSPWCLLSSAQDVCSTSTSPAMTRSEGHPALRLVCRVSCVVHRVSCIVHRVSCIVYRVSCMVHRPTIQQTNPNTTQHDHPTTTRQQPIRNSARTRTRTLSRPRLVPASSPRLRLPEPTHPYRNGYPRHDDGHHDTHVSCRVEVVPSKEREPVRDTGLAYRGHGTRSSRNSPMGYTRHETASARPPPDHLHEITSYNTRSTARPRTEDRSEVVTP